MRDLVWLPLTHFWRPVFILLDDSDGGHAGKKGQLGKGVSLALKMTSCPQSIVWGQIRSLS